jgi:hypothetical protein
MTMTPSGRKVRKILITGLAIIIGVPAIVLVGIYALLGGFRDNLADDAAQPIGHSIEAVHGRQVCASGDAGFGPDNIQPWYQSYYEVPDSPELEKTLIAAAAKQGYSLVRVSPSHVTKPPSQELHAKQLGRDLEVYIYRDKQAQAGCDAGEQPRAAAGNDIVLVALTYPFRDIGTD